MNSSICTVENSVLKLPESRLPEGEYIIVPETENSLFLFDAEKFGDVMNEMVQEIKSDAQNLIRYMLSNSMMAEVKNDCIILPEKVLKYITVKELRITDYGKYYELSVVV